MKACIIVVLAWYLANLTLVSCRIPFSKERSLRFRMFGYGALQFTCAIILGCVATFLSGDKAYQFHQTLAAYGMLADGPLVVLALIVMTFSTIGSLALTIGHLPMMFGSWLMPDREVKTWA